MRIVLFHCKEFQTAVTELSDLPKDLRPEDISDENGEMELHNCIVALTTVESKDDPLVAQNLAEEAAGMADAVGTRAIVIFPFAHLSNDLAPSELALKVLRDAVSGLSAYDVSQAHFGSHKELLLHLYGHSRNVRYREF